MMTLHVILEIWRFFSKLEDRVSGYNDKIFMSKFVFLMLSKKHQEINRVGPVDKRPSTDRLAPPHCPKKNFFKSLFDIWHVTYDTLKEVNMLSKLKVPSSYRFGVKVF